MSNYSRDDFVKTAHFNNVTNNGNDGATYRYALAHATLTVNTLYAILVDATSRGLVTAAIADDAARYRVGIAMEATVTGDIAKLKTGGYHASLTTPTLSVSDEHTLEIGGGAIIDGAAQPIAADNHFAINVGGATTNAENHSVILLDREVTAST